MIIRVCERCGNNFSTENKSKKFCSKQCLKEHMSESFSGNKNPFWKETKYLRPSNKKSIIKHVKSTQSQCQVCGSNETLQVHHIDSNPLNNSNENLLLLCRLHHADAHRIMGEENLVGLIMASGRQRRADIECCVCGSVFHPPKSKVKCCSSACAVKEAAHTRLEKTKRKCNLCGKEYFYNHKNQKFCSVECADKSGRIRTPKHKGFCIMCGKEFVSCARTRKYCSYTCNKKSLRENGAKY